MELIEVLLHKTNGYDKGQLREQLDDSLQELGVPELCHGTKVLLKPNLISSRAPQLACTNGLFIVSVAECFLDRGATVVIGDSPSFGSAGHVLRSQGIEPHIAHLDLEIVEFKTPQIYHLKSGTEIGIAQEALDCDLFINLPKIKAHNQMYVTMAVKNLFGIVCGMRKALAHMKNGYSHSRFANVMIDLSQVIPPSLTIADGIEIMHREGPIGGELLRLNCLALSRDPVALDTALLYALELDPLKCPVFEAAQKRGIAGSNLKAIDFSRAAPSEFFGSGFQAPQLLNPVPFNPFMFFVNSIKKLFLAKSW